MNIIDRARDALNRFKSTEASDTERAAYLAKWLPKFAAEVVRLHDELEALADDLVEQANEATDALGGATSESTSKFFAASRIREVIGGSDK